MRRSEDIKGFKYKSFETKICQFADDTQILLDGSEQSIQNTITLLNNYSIISGLKVNYNKSELAPLGRSRMEIYTHNFSPGMKVTLDKLTILGIVIPTNGNIKDLVNLNFEEKKSKIEHIIDVWGKRNLTLFGKITILKNLVIPQLTYLLSVLPSPGENYLKTIDKAMISFLWDNKPPKIQREVICQRISNGGLNLTDIFTYNKSVKFQWIKKLLDENFESTWKKLVKQKLYIFENNLIFKCDLKQEDLEQLGIKSVFWRDILKYYFELKSMDKYKVNKDSVIWFNSSLKINGKILFDKKMFDKGIIYIKNLLKNNNHFKSFVEFQSEFNLQTNYLHYFSLQSVVKSKMDTVTAEEDEVGDSLIEVILNSNNLSKEMYSKLRRDVDEKVIIKGIDKWKNEAWNELTVENSFPEISIITNDFILKNFQFKLLHRILPTNKYLTMIGIKNCDKCNFCNLTTDSIFHYLWQCPIVEEFWQALKHWIEEKFECQVIFTVKSNIFSVNENDSPFPLYDFIIIFARYYIHCCKWSDKKPSLYVFVEKLLNREKIERINALHLDNLYKHNEMWKKLSENSML